MMLMYSCPPTSSSPTFGSVYVLWRKFGRSSLYDELKDVFDMHNVHVI